MSRKLLARSCVSCLSLAHFLNPPSHGEAPGVPNSKTAPYVRSKGRDGVQCFGLEGSNWVHNGTVVLSLSPTGTGPRGILCERNGKSSSFTRRKTSSIVRPQVREVPRPQEVPRLQGVGALGVLGHGASRQSGAAAQRKELRVFRKVSLTSWHMLALQTF